MPHTIPHTMLHTMPHTIPHTKPHRKPHTMPHTMPHIVPHTMLHTMPHTMPHTKPHTMPYTMPHADTDTHRDTDIICHNNVTTTLNFATPYTIIHECNDITMLKQNYTIIHASPMLLHNLNTKCFNNMLLLPNKAQPL